MDFYINSILTPKLHFVAFYLHSAANLSAASKPPGPSKYETNSTHIREGLGLFVFALWIAAYECSTFFLNVRPRQPGTSEKKESLVTLL